MEQSTLPFFIFPNNGLLARKRSEEIMQRILSGIQPSGKLHIGNYFGMMEPMLAHMASSELYVFIVDLHALTSVQDPERLRRGTLEAAADFLALGLDPDRCTFWVQSDVPEVCELTWLLSIVTPMGLLERCHSYKDKVAKNIPASHGLFSYPVLMAADILLYQPHLVPVGKDQKQHIEVTRDIAIRFNNTFGETFLVPDGEISENTAVIPGLDGQKMSKSYDNTIPIFADEKELRKKVMAIQTDATPVEAPKNPDTCNLYTLLKLFAPEDKMAEVHELYVNGGAAYGYLKQDLFELINARFAPARKRKQELLDNPDYVRQVLAKGADKAREKAMKTLQLARERVGLKY